MNVVRVKPSVIEWFDKEYDADTLALIEQLRRQDHTVNTHEILSRGDIDRLHREQVGLVVTEMDLPTEGLDPYSPPDQYADFGGELRDFAPSSCQGQLGGLVLCESLRWGYGANSGTPIIALTEVSNMDVEGLAAHHVGYNYYKKPIEDDGSQLIAAIRKCLPPSRE